MHAYSHRVLRKEPVLIAYYSKTEKHSIAESPASKQELLSL